MSRLDAKWPWCRSGQGIGAGIAKGLAAAGDGRGGPTGTGQIPWSRRFKDAGGPASRSLATLPRHRRGANVLETSGLRRADVLVNNADLQVRSIEAITEEEFHPALSHKRTRSSSG